MIEYYFLFILAFIAVLFAVIQDLRFHEIANWLTFSLIAFILTYRAFYAIVFHDASFFFFGLGGIILFVALGFLLYYARVFAGGDAKLLFGLGGIFPYTSFSDYILYGLGFIVLLFICGIIYTLIYTIFLVRKQWTSFSKSFVQEIFRLKWLFILGILFAVISGILISFILGLLFLLFPLIYTYAHVVEHVCMIRLTSPYILTEGDWLVKDVKIGNKFIRKNVHGLSYKEILFLREKGKKIWIKFGVPFAPVFFFALLLFFLFYGKFLNWKMLF